ncbi:MAG: CatB-related O-acetyltransferase [Candidatus Omnitrophota bacterium]
MKFEDFKDKFKDKKYNNIFESTAVVCCDCEVKNSTLGNYSRLKPNTEFKSSTLGDYSIVSSFSIINASDIGKFNSIGPGVFIGLWEHNRWVSTHSFYLSEACGEFVKGFGSYEKDELRVSIGNDVWIGANAVILKGVTIGDGAIVGAGSVITKDVEPYSIVVGNKQRLVRYRFEKDDIDFLLKVKWWDFPREVIKDMVDKKVWDKIEKFKDYYRENLITKKV